MQFGLWAKFRKTGQSALFLAVCALAGKEAFASTTLATVADPASVRQRHDMNFEVEYLARDQGWVPEVISRADAARLLVNGATHDTFLVAIRIVLAPDRARLGSDESNQGCNGPKRPRD